MIEPGTIYLDGEYLDYKDAHLPVLTHALHYGLAAFEGIRAYRTDDGRTAIFRLRDHLERLLSSARMILFKQTPTVEVLREVCHELLRRNHLPEAYLRPLLFSGHGQMGLYAPGNPVRVMVATWPWGAYLGDEAIAKGVRCCVSTYQRAPASSMLSKAKVAANYVTSILAKAEAKGRGYDEALMPDERGRIIEGSGENLFYVRNGTLHTPPESAPILHGVTRQTVLELAAEFGMSIGYDSPPRDLLYLSSEVFLTGTAAELTPVREVDGHVIGSGKPGPITKRIQTAFFDIVRGRREAPSGWLDTVEF
ncbi:MAG: branched-chain amino acid transaminase [Planctomycetes bacterium]|nr:branched-chain amino acid transaminase [Planctomycetota bacterium]